MWKIVLVFICAGLVGVNARLPDDYVETLAETSFRMLCSLRGKNDATDRVITAFREMTVCADEVNSMKTLRNTYITTKSSAQWDSLFTNMCNKLDTKKNCMEDFDKVAIECMDETQFIAYSSYGNATVDFIGEVCRKKKHTLIDFIMNNGWQCYAESNRLIIDCIRKGRVAKSNKLTSEEVQTNIDMCYILIPCDEESAAELVEKYKFLVDE